MPSVVNGILLDYLDIGSGTESVLGLGRGIVERRARGSAYRWP